MIVIAFATATMKILEDELPKCLQNLKWKVFLCVKKLAINHQFFM